MSTKGGSYAYGALLAFAVLMIGSILPMTSRSDSLEAAVGLYAVSVPVLTALFQIERAVPNFMFHTAKPRERADDERLAMFFGPGTWLLATAAVFLHFGWFFLICFGIGAAAASTFYYRHMKYLAELHKVPWPPRNASADGPPHDGTDAGDDGGV